MTAKTLTLKKTIVSESKIILADSQRRSNIYNASQSVRVGEVGKGVMQGDVTVSASNPLVLDTILGFLLLEAWAPFTLKLKNNDMWSSDIQCSGLFIFHGSLQEVEVTSLTEIRLRYVYA